MAGGNYDAFGIRTSESTLSTTYRGTAPQIADSCIATDAELREARARSGGSLRLDRLGNEVRGIGAHRIVECKGADRYTVIVLHDDDEVDRRMELAGAASKARADRAFQAMLQRLGL